jgi:PII-like signaling protein
MNETEVIVVRIYLHEAKAHLAELLQYLHDESKVRGVTVFRGITGFGSSGEIH